MNWQKVIEDIIESGFSEKEIAEIVDSTQPTINRIKNGLTKEPFYTLGSRLIKLTYLAPVLTNQRLKDVIMSDGLPHEKKCA